MLINDITSINRLNFYKATYAMHLSSLRNILLTFHLFEVYQMYVKNPILYKEEPVNLMLYDNLRRRSFF